MREMISAEISRFVQECRDNRFPGSNEPYFDDALIGFAAASDPLFREYNRIIGDFHRLPAEILEGAATVVCWVLPVSRATRVSNRRQERWPSLEWSLTRNNGENFNTLLRHHMVAWLEGRGHRAVAPQLAPDWRQLDDPVAGIASSWSERHAAYAAGLGTFSLNDGLITARGIAHRLGSVVTDLELPPTPRSAGGYRSNCLYHRDGSCGVCISRCPVGAISRQGHDKDVCRGYVYRTVPEAVGELYGVPQTGCGLCQTRVPCEERIPGGKNLSGNSP